MLPSQDLIGVALKEATSRTYTMHLRCLPEITRGHLLLPVQSALTVSLPAPGVDPKTHAAFTPTEQDFISTFDLNAVVISSKEKPKRITVYSKSARAHTFLCKAEKRGDLRKDSRMMEFNTMVNRYSTLTYT